jgi:hypothetical protein
MVIVADQVQVSVEDFGKDRRREREGTEGLLYRTDAVNLSVSINTAFEDRSLGPVARNVRGNLRPKE